MKVHFVLLVNARLVSEMELMNVGGIHLARHERGIECKNIIVITYLTQQSYVA